MKMIRKILLENLNFWGIQLAKKIVNWRIKSQKIMKVATNHDISKNITSKIKIKEELTVRVDILLRALNIHTYIYTLPSKS